MKLSDILLIAAGVCAAIAGIEVWRRKQKK